jgi:hypothetical protein
MLNPNYLLKDELQYELLIRSIKSEAEVQTLRTLFRTAVIENVAVNLNEMSELYVQELYQTIVCKVAELRNIVASESAETVTLVPRLRAKIFHVQERLRHLKITNQASGNISSDELQQQQHLLEAVADDLNKMEAAQSSSPTRGEQPPNKDESRDEAVTKTTAPDCAAWLEPFPGGENAVAQDTDATTRTAVQQRDNSGSGSTQVFTPHFYQRLPHPLSNLIKELEIVDGTKVRQLCDFLLKVLKIKEIG